MHPVSVCELGRGRRTLRHSRSSQRRGPGEEEGPNWNASAGGGAGWHWHSTETWLCLLVHARVSSGSRSMRRGADRWTVQPQKIGPGSGKAMVQRHS
jgi:hypothetical protein